LWTTVQRVTLAAVNRSAEKAAMATFSVVTLNTWKADGDYGHRVGLICDGLKALDPDVVLLQEVFADASGAVHTGEAVRERLRLHHVHHPARRKPWPLFGVTVDSTSGLSMLTRTPVADVRRVDLPASPEDGERIAQVAAWSWEGAPVTLVNLHLTHLPDADDLRIAQLDTTLDAMAPSTVDAAVIGGDLNAEPDGRPIRWLGEQSTLAVRDAVAEGATGPLPTLADTGGREMGSRRVDHLLVAEHGTGRRLRVASAERVLDTPDPASGLLPSDHAGLLVRFGWA